ncbi:MAG: hypothetical protein R2827_09030 [Bdellovibrionales bacterium]
MSALTIGGLLPMFQDWVGMPLDVLYVLAAWALLYAVYSLSCWRVQPKTTLWIKAIVVANVLYCVATFSLLLYFMNDIKPLGWVYFLGEIGIILGLVTIERKFIFTSPNEIAVF